MKIIFDFSPNYNNSLRIPRDIKFVIIHYTGMQSEIESIKRLKDTKYKVSCHYLVNRKGKIIQMVNDRNIAWHAGKSQWGRFVNLNKNSIGIELINRGHEFGYQNFTSEQINSLLKLLNNYILDEKNNKDFDQNEKDLMKKILASIVELEKINKNKLGFFDSLNSYLYDSINK